MLMSNGGFGGIHGKLLAALERDERDVQLQSSMRRSRWHCNGNCR